ncbi:MAG: transglutaminase family protein [Planctomycetaceae bacterium]|nr:MAG: transglutaminase family protein [Planctomycetaceae bacterium]
MTIRVALHHRTEYLYDRLVTLGPQQVRLRPAFHARTPIEAYCMRVSPSDHFVNQQQDPHGNPVARYVFAKPTDHFSVTVDLIANMTVINPFDFFVEEFADKYPFRYPPELRRQLQPYLDCDPISPGGEATPLLDQWVSSLPSTSDRMTDFLVDMNMRLHQRIEYLVRLEPGVQTPEYSLAIGSGSCRDSAWLLVATLRRLGLAARFVSGYLIQLAGDVKPLDGPAGPENDFCDLHAWAEVYIPGAGWIGLDATSGLFCGEGHIPLACTPEPRDAAPITGGLGVCEVEFRHEMEVRRIHEDPRVTKPYTETQWQEIMRLGQQVDAKLNASDCRLTIGGEPTFVSIDSMDTPEWTTEAVGPDKRVLSNILLLRLRERFAPGGMLHYGQGKWYPGESLPRWALTCIWRKDGVPLWKNPKLIADEGFDYGHTHQDAERFVVQLSKRLGVSAKARFPVYEDIFHYLWKEDRLPIDVDPEDPKLNDPNERAGMIRIFRGGLAKPVGYVLPLQRAWWQTQSLQPREGWLTGRWPVRSEKVYLLPGDSPIGLRLPLDSLPHAGAEAAALLTTPFDPTAPRGNLPLPRGSRKVVDPTEQLRPEATGRQQSVAGAGGANQSDPDPKFFGAQRINPQVLQQQPDHTESAESEESDDPDVDPSRVVRTALAVEARHGRLYVFMPPTQRLEDYLELVEVIEEACDATGLPAILEGYLPPADHRVSIFKVTPDPGVIEVNTQPSESWEELVSITETLYEEARHCRLGTEKFDLDGLHTGTGGGNHIVLGGSSPKDSPFLRRPDLLASLITFWNNHPSLSYLFSSKFIGPTSQAPRFDEGRPDAVFEMQIALNQLPPRDAPTPNWVVDRLFRNLLVDLTGNTHRTEICIDKLYSPDSSTGRLGLVEFRGFEMPPHARMSLTQQLLIRALIAAFWERPYRQPLINWGTSLHDRFLLPHFAWQDLRSCLDELATRGTRLREEWFLPHFEFRFPQIGDVIRGDVKLSLRSAIEPWYVLGEEPGGGGTVRFVDSSLERIQVLVDGYIEGRHSVLCNGTRVPLRATGVPQQFVAGVRYRAWQPPSCLHPTIPVHAPLRFDLVDRRSGKSQGGCTYYVSHPGGLSYETFPINASEAEARRASRFRTDGMSGGPIEVPELPPSIEGNPFPVTLDLRTVPRQPDWR